MERKSIAIRVLIFTTVYVLCVSQKDIKEYAVPKNCNAFYIFDRTGVALQCKVDYIEAGGINFSVIPTIYTQSIKMTCSSLFNSPSSLKNVFYPPFPELMQLVFERCKFTSLSERDLEPFQEKLLYLTIQSEHDAKHDLKIHRSAVGNLRKLQYLDLAYNNIPEFPEKELCQLSDLREVILNHNDLSDIANFGFSGTCLPDDMVEPCASMLETLDLSHNQISSLPSNSFCKTPNLKNLDFEHNKISTIEDGAFLNLHSLEWLILSLNNITALGPKTFLDLNSLTFINVSHNKINATIYLPGNLQALDLSFNQIRTIDERFLRPLTNLTQLSLASNQIEQLGDGLFSFLSKLTVLDLQNNHISTISKNTFSGIKNISVVSLEGNDLTSVDEHAFQTCINLRALYLCNNYLTTINIVSYLPSLTELDLSTNYLIYMNERSFASLNNLEKLFLENNMLEELPENLFANLTNLSLLDLSNNKLQIIDDNTFSNNLNLKRLKLCRNKLHTMANLQLNAHLAELDMSNNRLAMLIYRFLPKSLKVLKMDHNIITSVEEVLSAASATAITDLDLSNNLLTIITSTSLPHTLEVLDLSYNHISHIYSNSFSSMKSLELVSLEANNITTMLKEALTIHPDKLERPKFVLFDNQLQCSCDMLWLKTINSIINYRYAFIIDLEILYCRLPMVNQPQKFDLSRVVNSKGTMFLCDFDKYEFQAKELCNAFKPEASPVCVMTCPKDCFCLRDLNLNIVFIICSRANLTEVPLNIPILTTVFYLDGNFISSIDENSFEFYPKLQQLYLNGSGLQTLGNGSFTNMPNVKTLHLENNSLQELTVDVFSGLDNLTELYLSWNKLHQIHEKVFVPLVSLHTLRLQNNQLVNFPVAEFSRMEQLGSIALGENPWSCDCDYVDKYHEWFQESAEKIVDIENLKCYPEMEGSSISLINFNATFCMDLSKIHLSYIPVIASTTTIFLAISGICILVFVYRHEMQVLVYSRYGARLLNRSREVNDETKIYDAFISYSNDDEELVVTTLLPKLENLEFPYKLCLHQRDFAVGAFITESILEAVQYSRRTIVILTDGFVQSEWCRFEFKTAHMQMMKDKCNRVIVTVVGKIPKNLDPEMKLYLKTNTYLQWDDKLFWQKLYFALPEKRPKH